MTNEEIKKIVDDERVEQLTVQACHHWEIATQRLDELTKELDAKVDTCVEAEIYAAQMRMQSAVMALVELNKMPCAYFIPSISSGEVSKRTKMTFSPFLPRSTASSAVNTT